MNTNPMCMITIPRAMQYHIVRIISPWAISHTSTLNRVGLYTSYTYTRTSSLRGWACNTYYTVSTYSTKFHRICPPVSCRLLASLIANPASRKREERLRRVAEKQAALQREEEEKKKRAQGLRSRDNELKKQRITQKKVKEMEEKNKKAKVLTLPKENTS